MIRAVIADDSAFLRQVLQEVLEAKKTIEVVGAGKNGKEAVSLVEALDPDVLILDCEMPVMNGLEALRTIMGSHPLPVIMFSSLTREGASVTVKALEYGAVDFLLKPAAGARALDEVADELIKKIEIFVRRAQYRKVDGIHRETRESVARLAPTLSSLGVKKRQVDIIAVGSSTGGVQAATALLTRLPQRTRPIVWVQHMPPSFTASFAERLNSLSKITVKEAADGDVLQDDTCYIGRGGLQMRVEKKYTGYVLRVAGQEKVSGHCPSCNVLFESVSQHFGKTALGVILTGMGDDGTKGLKMMHDNGSFVVGQREESCVVYGMPKAAFQAGAVDIEFDVENIAQAIGELGGAFA